MVFEYADTDLAGQHPPCPHAAQPPAADLAMLPPYHVETPPIHPRHLVAFPINGVRLGIISHGVNHKYYLRPVEH